MQPLLLGEEGAVEGRLSVADCDDVLALELLFPVEVRRVRDLATFKACKDRGSVQIRQSCLDEFGQ